MSTEDTPSSQTTPEPTPPKKEPEKVNKTPHTNADELPDLSDNTNEIRVTERELQQQLQEAGLYYQSLGETLRRLENSHSKMMEQHRSSSHRENNYKQKISELNSQLLEEKTKSRTYGFLCLALLIITVILFTYLKSNSEHNQSIEKLLSQKILIDSNQETNSNEPLSKENNSVIDQQTPSDTKEDTNKQPTTAPEQEKAEEIDNSPSTPILNENIETKDDEETHVVNIEAELTEKGKSKLIKDLWKKYKKAMKEENEEECKTHLKAIVDLDPQHQAKELLEILNKPKEAILNENKVDDTKNSEETEQKTETAPTIEVIDMK